MSEKCKLSLNRVFPRAVSGWYTAVACGWRSKDYQKLWVRHQSVITADKEQEENYNAGGFKRK
jgi:hypothetical protein